jgi:hypothetical protein
MSKDWPEFPETSRIHGNLLLTPPTTDEQFNADWSILKGEEPGLPRLDEDGLRKFVVEFLRGDIFTSAQLRDSELLHMVFLPLAFGATKDFSEESIREIGVIWAYMSTALPRSVNGYPIFGACCLMHKDDWARASLAIQREQDREKSIIV